MRSAPSAAARFALDVDVTQPEQVQAMADRTVAEFGRIDILVNNAGLALVSGKKNLWEVDDDEWRREIDVNLNGVFHCCKAVARVLVEQKEGGRIVNISSLAGRVAQPQYGATRPPSSPSSASPRRSPSSLPRTASTSTASPPAQPTPT